MNMDRLNELRQRQLELLDKLESPECGFEYGNIQVAMMNVEDEIESLHKAMQGKRVTTAVAGATTPKRQRNAQLYHLRLSLTEKYSIADFDKLMTKMSKSAYVQSGMFVYVYEQSGVDAETRGRNPHAHIRFKSMEPHGRLLAKVKRASGMDNAAVKLVTHDNVNALRQYMAGHKGAGKVEACRQDIIWRATCGLKNEYILS